MFRIATSKVINCQGWASPYRAPPPVFNRWGPIQNQREEPVCRHRYAFPGSAFAYNEVGAAANGVADFNKVRADIVNLLDDENAKNPSVDGASNGGGGAIAPMLLRLAWHCSGTWCKTAKNGGSEGSTMRFKPECDHGGNAGLGIARDLLEPIKKKHPNITYADLYILAGCVAVEEMGGPKIGFRYGRSDAEKPAAPKEDPRFSPDGRLPDGDKDAQHIRDIFYRMGFDDKGIVALSGAHAVGRCTPIQWFLGPWTRAESTFSNEYYRLMLGRNGPQRQSTMDASGKDHHNLKIQKVI